MAGPPDPGPPDPGPPDPGPPDPGPPDPGPPSPPGRRPRPIFLLAGVVLAVGLGIGLFTGVGTGGGSKGTPALLQAGSAVPAFSLPALAGGPRVGIPADGGSAGRPAVVLYFASWCPPCRTEIPAVAATYRHQQAAHSPLARVALIGIDENDTAAAGLRFVRAAHVSFPVGVDSTFDATGGHLGLTGLPDAVFVNANGTIAAVHQGAVSTSLLTEWQSRLLSGG
ncbi:MAG: TlpA family protein disulfide reductase [Acidimicrobiales bacterium]